MKRPDYTCPKKEEIEDILKEFSDTKHSETELSNIVEKLIKEYKSQYEWYVDKILFKLDEYKDSVEKVRDWGEYLESENERLESENWDMKKDIDKMTDEILELRSELNAR